MKLRYAFASLALFATACPGDDGGDDDGGNDGTSAATSADDGTSADGSDETGAPPTGDVPTDSAALVPWLNAESYAGWDVESGIHASTGPHGQVLTYFNDALVASFDAGNTTHPVGSASVKELYDAMDVRIGWAVMVKVADNDTAESWYWYGEAGGMVLGDGNGVAGCEGCHNADGVDRVLTPYPLQ